jgi:hypothetical protein
VVACLVQNILDYDLIYLRSRQCPQAWNRQMGMEARREVQKQLFEWLSTHMFSTDLVKEYGEIAVNS